MKFFKVLVLFAIILIAFGCDDKSPTENDPEPGEVVLSDETVVLDETQVNEDLQTISPDGNTFTFTNNSTTDDIEEGDILVSGITDLSPNGFLKKVTNVQENSNLITVTTENASLDEALQQGDLETSYTFEPSRIVNATYTNGVELITNSREDLFSLTINMIFYDADGNTNTTDDQITMVGTLEFTAEMLMNLSISNWELDEFDIQLVNTFERDLTLNNNIEYNLQDEVTIASYDFPVITFFIGIVPVTILPTINVTAYVDASLQAGISFGVTATETMTTGAQYLNGNWSPISSYTKTLNYSGPSGYGSIEAQAGLKPQLQTMLYGVIGPYLVLDAYGRFDCEVEVNFDDLIISEEILFGLDLDAGILIEVLSHTIANFSMDIYDEEWILHQYEYTIGQAPVATIISPSNGAQYDFGDNVHFEGTASDIQDGNLTGNSLEWFSNNDGSLGFGEDLYISSLSQGSHSITLIATDSDDYTGEDEVSVNILGAGNNPPSMPFNPSPSHEAINISINTDLFWDCTDPDPNDILTYDVYFGTSANPPLIEEDWSDSTYNLDELDPDETYYWQIVAYDNHNNSTTGEIWEFTTMEDGGGSIILSEDFDSDPNFEFLGYTPQAGEYFEWDSIDEIYKIRILEEDGGIEKFIYTPVFLTIENQSFSLDVDIKGIEKSWGMSLGMTFVYDAFEQSNNSMHIYYNGTHDKITISDEVNGYDTGNSSVNLNIWYHISLVYNAEANTANINITERDSGNVIYDTDNVTFNPAHFNRIALGHRTLFWDGDTAANHYDNIQIEILD